MYTCMFSIIAYRPLGAFLLHFLGHLFRNYGAGSNGIFRHAEFETSRTCGQFTQNPSRPSTELVGQRSLPSKISFSLLDFAFNS